MAGSTPLLNAEIEALAKIIAQQPHALELKAEFDSIFVETRLQMRRVDIGKIKRLSDCPKMSD